jgi:sugar O-acyltransferase (sialic acid O-acetyltransferase NeuD family)
MNSSNGPIKEIVVAGCGGFAKEIIGYISQDIKKGIISGIKFKGVVISYEEYKKFDIGLTYLGNEHEYEIEENDYFIVPVGNIAIRNDIINILEERGAKFFTYIHPSAYIAPSCTIGKGSIVCPFCIINENARVGDHVVLNIYCSIGHDSVLGDNSVMSPYCTLNGYVKTGKNLFMGTRSTILMRVNVGNNCSISVHSFVKSDKGDNRIILNEVKHVEMLDRRITKPEKL